MWTAFVKSPQWDPAWDGDEHWSTAEELCWLSSNPVWLDAVGDPGEGLII